MRRKTRCDSGVLTPRLGDMHAGVPTIPPCTVNCPAESDRRLVSGGHRVETLGETEVHDLHVTLILQMLGGSIAAHFGHGRRLQRNTPPVHRLIQPVLPTTSVLRV